MTRAQQAILVWFALLGGCGWFWLGMLIRSPRLAIAGLVLAIGSLALSTCNLAHKEGR